MLRVIFSAWLVAACIAIAGCSGDPVPTATTPQAATQMAKTDEQKMDYLVEMLHRKENLKKNAQAARELGRMGAVAAPVIPELRKAMEQSTDERVRSDAKEAIKAIEDAVGKVS